jgi:hypothetical protein
MQAPEQINRKLENFVYKKASALSPSRRKAPGIWMPAVFFICCELRLMVDDAALAVAAGNMASHPVAATRASCWIRLCLNNLSRCAWLRSGAISQ